MSDIHNVSEIFKEIVPHPGREWHYKADITLKDGTFYELNDADIVQKGIEFDAQVSTTSDFQYGGILANSLTLTINNFDGRYTQTNFEGAQAVIYVGLVVEQHWEKGNVTEWVCLGSFVIEKSNIRGLTMSLEAYDQTFAFDKKYSLSSLTYPATLREILEDACNCCGVVLATDEFTNADYVVDERPADKDISFRQVLENLAPLTASFITFDETGKLMLKWYDTQAEPCADVDFPEDMWSFDVVITGIKAKNQLTEEEFMVGEEGYVIDLTRNSLCQNKTRELLQALGDKTIGFSFRPFAGEISSNPALEAGDPVLVYDRQGNAYRSYAMVYHYSMGNPVTIGAFSKSVAWTQSYQETAHEAAVNASKQEIDKKVDLYDTYAKQFAAMAAATIGYYVTTETLEDGSIITYSHDKPLLSESTNIWKKNGLTVAVSNDGGKTWRGLDKDGNAILNDIAAKTITADKIISGKMQTADGRFYIDLDKGESTATKLIGGSLIGDRKVEAIIGQKSDNITAVEGIVVSVDGDTKIGLNYPMENFEDILPAGIYIKTPEGNFGNIQFKDGMISITPPESGEKLMRKVELAYSHLILTMGAHISSEIGGMTSPAPITFDVPICVANSGASSSTIEGDLHVDGDLVVEGNLTAFETKSRVVETSKGKVCVNAYETAEPYFGDIGEAQTDENGQICINIEPLFAETVNTSCPYQVFLQSYCDGSFYVSQRTETYFTVSGTPNGAFGYEIKARQKGYENSRLEHFNVQ